MHRLGLVWKGAIGPTQKIKLTAPKKIQNPYRVSIPALGSALGPRLGRLMAS